MELNVSSWKEFRLDELFDFVKGKRLTKADMVPGSLNYLGAISDNNGVRDHIEADTSWDGNCITVNYNGSVGEAFYQKDPFWPSDDVNCLYAKGWLMTEQIGLFLCTVIKANKYRFSYGRKWTIEKMKESIIRLPVNREGKPDWGYMQSFVEEIQNRERESGTSLRDCLIPNLEVRTSNSDGVIYKEFLLSDLVEIINGKGITQDEIDLNPGNLEAVQSGEENMGVMGWIDLEYCRERKYSMSLEPCLTVARSGTAGFVSFHRNGCVVGDSAKLIILKESIEEPCSVYLYLCTVLNKNRYKYSYGRKVTKEKYGNTLIRLPCTSEGRPDYTFMASAINRMPYSDRLAD